MKSAAFFFQERIENHEHAVWKRMTPTGSSIWILGPHLVDRFGKDSGEAFLEEAHH